MKSSRLHALFIKYVVLLVPFCLIVYICVYIEILNNSFSLCKIIIIISDDKLLCSVRAYLTIK